MRVRFAPSPTGYLHVGGARTALFNWLLARGEGAVFVLRIEDTDRARSSEEHTRAILEGMSWLGLDWDEGPLFQSDGGDRHREDALRLLEEGKAYRDFTDPDALREEARDRGMERVSRLAREKAREMPEEELRRRLDAEEPWALRFRVPAGETSWVDRVHGRRAFPNADVEDLVLLRADGTATYNMAVVSDDAHMGITHVVRGDDHLSNTPKQILLYEALGKPVPEFAHVPLILGADGKRLSKRHGATAVGAYEDEGILPEAMVNFLALLGWSPGDDREVMSREELVEAFSLERILTKSSVFDREKLEWLNGQYMAEAPAGELAPRVLARLRERGVETEELAQRTGWLQGLIDLLKVRSRTVDELAWQALPFVREEVEYEEKAVAKHWGRDPAAVTARLRALRERLAEVAWEAEPLETELRALAGELGVGAGKLIHPLRLAVTGRGTSPGIFRVLTTLGRERALARLDAGLTRVAQLDRRGSEGAGLS